MANKATVRNPVPAATVLFQDVPYDLNRVQFVCEWRPANKGEFYLHTDKSGRTEHVMAQMQRDDNNSVIRPIIVGIACRAEGWLLYLEDMNPISTTK